MTLGEIQEKAMALQRVRVDDSLETEIRKLNHLRDRASEMGHRKELREYVEKIELLKSPEERIRRIKKIPDVHVDPRMDPSYGSDDDSGESEIKKQDGSVTPNHNNLKVKGAELVSPVKEGNPLKDGRTVKTCVANGDHKRENSERFNVRKVETSKRPLKTERVDDSKTLEELKNRVGLTIISGQSGTTRPIPQATSFSTPQTAVSSQTLVSDITELEKIWHYRDPSGKVQGPFCMLQLRKWDSSGFFPTDLRVWKFSQTPNQSILLTNALKKQTREPELNVELYKKVSKQEDSSSSPNPPSVSHKLNEENNSKSLTDINATSEANDLPSNGFTSLLLSDDQGGLGQSGLDMKARLIESLFDTEEPSSIATPSGPSETIHINHNIESSHPLTSTLKSNNVDFESQGVQSQPSSPNAELQDIGDEIGLSCNGAEPSDLPCLTSNSKREDKTRNFENRVISNISENFNACRGTSSSATQISKSSLSPKMECKEVYNYIVNKHSARYDQVSGTGSTYTETVSVEMKNEGVKPHTVENGYSNSGPFRPDSKAVLSTISDVTNVNVLPNNNTNMEGTKTHPVENKVGAGSNIPAPSGTNWSSLSLGLGFSDFPTTSPKLDEGQAVGSTNLTISNVNGQVSCISWSTTSNLAGGEVHLPNGACEWGGYSSVGSQLAGLGGDNTSQNLTNLDCDMSSWQPIEFSVLGDESVSDLLSEVEAMESLRGISSQLICGDDSIDSAGDDCFSPLGGLSPNLGLGRNDGLTSTSEMHFHINPDISSQSHGSFTIHDLQELPLSSPPPPPPPPPVSVPPPASTSSLDHSSRPHEEGEVGPASLLVHNQRQSSLDQSSSQRARMKVSVTDSKKQGSQNTSTGRDPSGHPNSKFPGTNSILGTPNLNYCMSVASQGTRGQSQTSPRYINHSNVVRPSGSKERGHNHHGVGSGFSKSSRPTQWSRQSSFGGGGGVCKFYESGYCNKGSSCKYLHP